MTKDALLTLWQANWAGVSDIEARFAHHWVSGIPNSVSDASFLFRWREAGQIYGDMSHGENQGKIASFDAVTGESRRRGKPQPFLGRSMLTDMVAGNGTEWASYSLRTPYPDTCEYYPKLWDLSALLSHSDSVVRPDLEMVDDRSVVVLDVYDLFPNQQVPLNMTVWLDPARNAVPLQWEFYQGVNTSVTSTALLSAYEQIGSTWFATNIQLFHGGGPHRGLVSEIQVSLDADGARHIRPNIGLTYSDVVIHFYPRAPVMNDDDGTLYLVQAPPQNLPEALERVYAFADQSNDVGGYSPAIVWLAVPALGIMSGVAIGFVRRAKSESLPKPPGRARSE